MPRMDLYIWTLDSDWHLHVGTIEAKGGDPQATLQTGSVLVSGTVSANTVCPISANRYCSTKSRDVCCEVAEIMIYDRELNEVELAQLEGSAHKWQMNNELLNSSHHIIQLIHLWKAIPMLSRFQLVETVRL